ncbi:MAG: hypothetical protein V4641_10345 [Pseudomonadota bacterium]
MHAHAFPIRVPSDVLEALGEFTGHFWSDFDHQYYFAMVAGAEIKYGEHVVSPSCFANLQGSGNRNAVINGCLPMSAGRRKKRP